MKKKQRKPRATLKSPSRVRRVGIMTGGGDCPGLNAVIRAVTKTLIGKYGVKVTGIRDGFRGLVLDQTTPLDYMAVSGILARGGTILGSSNKDNPFRFLVGTDGGNQYKDMSGKAMAVYRRHRLDALVCLGGDGTMSVANGLVKKGMNIVAVPKTIDNDLIGTDRTFGFDTSVGIVTEAVDRLRSTAASHHRCLVVETMGRYAGWIALEAGIAGGADIILIPEIPFKPSEVSRIVRWRFHEHKHYTIVLVAEGAKWQGGEMIVERTVDDSPDPIRLGGIGKVVAEFIEETTGVESRAIILGHVQRGGTPTAFDRVLATQYGYHAAELVAEKKFGKIVCLKGNRISEIPIRMVADKTRTVPVSSPLIAAARAVGTSFGDGLLPTPQSRKRKKALAAPAR